MKTPLATIEEVLSKSVDEILNPPCGIKLSDWPSFNTFTGGLRPREFSIFCGPTGAGKTLFLANLAAKLAEQDQKIFCAPVETGEVDFIKRMLSVYAGMDFTFGEPPSIDTQNKLKFVLSEKMEKIISNTLLTAYDGRVDIDEMIEMLQYAFEFHGSKVAILDNLNFFLKPSRSNETLLEMDEAVHKFVMFAKRTDMHVILVMHPRKTDGGKVVSEFDIKGSSTAVQEASNILLMNRLNEDDMEGTNLTEFDREFVFKKIRKRGRYVGKRFYLRSNEGRYFEVNKTSKVDHPWNGERASAKWR